MGNSLAVRIPKGLNPIEGDVVINRVGDRLIIEPVRESEWENGFFEDICITHPDFKRPDQGSVLPIDL